MTRWDSDRDHPLSCHWRAAAPEQYEALDLPKARSKGLAITQAQIVTEAFVVGRADPDEWISYSRRKTHYTNRWGRYWPHPSTYGTVVPAVDQLATCGLLDHQKMPSGHRRWQSRFRASDVLIDLLNKEPPAVVHAPREVIILRDHDGNLLDYNETERSHRWRRKVQEINEAILSA